MIALEPHRNSFSDRAERSNRGAGTRPLVICGPHKQYQDRSHLMSHTTGTDWKTESGEQYSTRELANAMVSYPRFDALWQNGASDSS